MKRLAFLVIGVLVAMAVSAAFRVSLGRASWFYLLIGLAIAAFVVFPPSDNEKKDE